LIKEKFRADAFQPIAENLITAFNLCEGLTKAIEFIINLR